MKKLIFAFILCAAFAACSGNKTNSSNTADTVQVDTVQVDSVK